MVEKNLPANLNEFIPGKLSENATPEAKKWAPVFDYVVDACYPSVAIGRGWVMNPKETDPSKPYILGEVSESSFTKAEGLSIGGAINGSCRDPQDLENSNTYHRSASETVDGATYSVHMYAQYFQKDQVTGGSGGAGHRHDLEYVAIWLKDGNVTHVGFSEHGAVGYYETAKLEFEDATHAKVVYEKSSALNTHHFRLANRGEKPVNQWNKFFTPAVVSWELMDEMLRSQFNHQDFGKASAPFNDKNFAKEINEKNVKNRPAGYPKFKVQLTSKDVM